MLIVRLSSKEAVYQLLNSPINFLFFICIELHTVIVVRFGGVAFWAADYVEPSSWRCSCFNVLMIGEFEDLTESCNLRGMV
jgi:hypothetical protein